MTKDGAGFMLLITDDASQWSARCPALATTLLHNRIKEVGFSESADLLLPRRRSRPRLLPGRDPEVPVESLIQAKDFVAGVSDERARDLHHELLTL